MLPVAFRSFTAKAASSSSCVSVCVVQNILKLIPKKKSPDAHLPPVFTLSFLLFQLFFVCQTADSDLSNKPLNVFVCYVL